MAGARQPDARPESGFGAWVLGQVASTSERLDLCGRAGRALRRQAAIRARSGWQEDRSAEAEVLGGGIARDPASVLARLRSTPQGCDWMIGRWAALGRLASLGAAWTEAQAGLAFDLLGTPAQERDDAPGRPAGEPGEIAPPPPGRAELARREIAGLRRRKADVQPSDAAERAAAEAGESVEPTAELRRLGRHEASLRRWLRWLVELLREGLPSVAGPAEARPAPPEPRPPAVEAEAEAEAEPSDRPGVPGASAEGRRKDPRALREAARREARRRPKGERPRS